MSSPPHKRERLGSLGGSADMLSKNVGLHHRGVQHNNNNNAPPARKSLGIAQGAAAGQTAPKKLTIKNAKPRTSTNDQEFANQALATFTRSIRAICAVPPEPTPESFSTLYSLCEGCITRATPYSSSAASGAGASTSSSSSSANSLAQTLYDRIRIELERKVGDIKRTLSHSANPDLASQSQQAAVQQQQPKAPQNDAAEAWLKHVNDEWNAFSQQLSLIRSVLTPLDRTFVLARKDLLSIWDLGLDIFRYKIVDDDDLSQRFPAGLLSYVRKQRDGSGSASLSLSVFHNIISTLSSLSSSSYDEHFVLPFLEASASYYAQEAEHMLLKNAEGSLSMGDYLKQVERRLAEEGERADAISSAAAVGGAAGSAPGSRGLKARILRIVEKQLVAEQTDDIVDGVSTVLRDTDDAGRLYSLFARVNALPQLKKALQSWIESQGFELIKDPARDESMVDNLLNFKKETDALFNGPLRKDQSMGFAIRDAFEAFINKRQNKPAEMLAKFIDAKMRLGNKAMAESEMEETFDQVLYLFNFTQAKDLFEAFYTRMFAKRLLLNKSASSDLEKIMLLKLQRACGAGFTSKLETMAKDMDLSADLMTAFREHRANTGTIDPFELSVNVLTTGNWPSFPPSQPILPQDMVTALERFKHFYAIKHTGRNLAWQHSLDQCTLKASFPKGKKELSVSLFQSLVLMLFNNTSPGEQLSFQSIVEQTNLDSKEAVRTLQSLACGRVRVLSKTPKGKDVNPGDSFTVNEDFTDPKLRIKINQIQIKETVEENKSTTDRVFVDRQNHVQLVIVRLLKSRKTMKHQELVMGVVDQLKNRFKVETAEIKKAISSLIDRDYMERSDAGKDVYNYVA